MKNNVAPHDDRFTKYVILQGKRKKRSKVRKDLLKEEMLKLRELQIICIVVYNCLHIVRDSETSHLKCHLDICVQRPNKLRNEDDSNEAFVFDMNELRRYILKFIFEGAHSLQQ